MAAASQEIPESIVLVASFLNSDIGTIPGLDAWMATRGLSHGDQDLGLDDVARVAEVGKGLRSWIRSGGVPAPQVLESINRASRAVPMTLTIDASGGTRVEPYSGSTVDRAIGAVLAAVHDAVTVGTWSRLKICRDQNCGLAFYDLSRNRSGLWCEMAVCGNRAKARRYRDRLRARKS